MISVGSHGEMRQRIKAGPSLQIQEKKTEDWFLLSCRAILWDPDQFFLSVDKSHTLWRSR